MNKYISEIITIDNIREWKPNDTIIISAGTGQGKSHFIKNSLWLVAKERKQKILFLVHRRNCKYQFIEEITKDKKDSEITIMTYQKLECDRNTKKFKVDISIYDYIVCDEFHYFISDAAFNITTDISLNLILQQTHAVKIFMSATGDYMKRYINNIKKVNTIDYEVPASYNFIKSLTYFLKDETLEEFIKEAITEGDKGIFFIQSAQKAYELFKRFKDYCLFNCGQSDKHYKHVNKTKIADMLKNERFEEQILITTTCMDAGVNIKDTELKHIVCDVEDIGTLIQCVSRKRIQNEKDKIYLYIKTISNQSLGGKKTQIKRKIEMADYLKENKDITKYINKYPRKYDTSNIVYDEPTGNKDDCTKKINELMHFKNSLDICDIELMLFYGKFGYCKFLATKFGFRDENTGQYNYRVLEENYLHNDLKKYLDSIIGKHLYKDEQKELIEVIKLRDSYNRQQKNYKLFNIYFETNKLPYNVISCKDKRRKLENGEDNPFRDKVY